MKRDQITPAARPDWLAPRKAPRPAAPDQPEAERKAKMVDKLRAVLTRPAYSAGELRVLRGVISSLDYFSPKSPRGAGYPERKAKADSAAHGSGRTDGEGGDD